MGVFSTVGCPRLFILVQMGHYSASDHPTQSNSIHIQCACIQDPNWEYLHLRSLCYGQGYIGRPPATSKSPEFGEAGTGPSSAITNVYCSRSEPMLCGILEQTNTPQPRQGINTGSPPRPPHRKQLCGRGCGGQLKTHMPRYINIHGHTDMCHIQDIRSGGLHFLKSWDRFLKFVQDLTASFGWELHGLADRSAAGPVLNW